jgi:hypothetical protein
LTQLTFRIGTDGTDGTRHPDVYPTTFLETFSSVLYDVAVFQPYAEFFAWLYSLPEHTTDADDIVIGKWLQLNGVRPYRYAIQRSMLTHDAQNTQELSTLNLQGNNMAVFESMRFARW